MNPFACLLHTIRMQRGIRQTELSDLIGYEQTYISALEIGKKGPPTPEFVERLITALDLKGEEREYRLSFKFMTAQFDRVMSGNSQIDIMNNRRSLLEYMDNGVVHKIF